MLIVISPAKSLDFDTPPATATYTQPAFLAQAEALIGVLRDYAPADIARLMELSDALAVLNVTRYAAWKRRHTVKNAKQAVLAFDGDVYDGLRAKTFTDSQLQFAQDRLRMLSGLYGVLRPLDLIQPYRLEMGTRLLTPAGKDLYAFWDDRITRELNKAIARSGTRVLVNLASQEYFGAVKPPLVRARIVTPVFQEWHGGEWKIISFHAKRARGLMSRYAITNGIDDVEALQDFNDEGYAFDAAASHTDTWIFRRKGS